MNLIYVNQTYATKNIILEHERGGKWSNCSAGGNQPYPKTFAT